MIYFLFILQLNISNGLIDIAFNSVGDLVFIFQKYSD
jgi:hypothetical protein